MKRRDFCAATLASTTAALLARRSFAAASSDIPAIGRTGAQRVLRGRDVEDLRASLRGALLLATDAGYEPARHLWNGSFDRRPALIARCAGAADVVQAVNFARAN